MPDQRLTLAEALAAYTAAGAYGMFAETDRGSLAVGQQADLILLTGDLTALAQSPDAARVTLTLCAGQEVWRG